MAYGGGNDFYPERVPKEPKDNRCTYRVWKDWSKEHNCYLYYPEYKKPNGWFWHSIPADYNEFGYVTNRLWSWKQIDAEKRCSRHARYYMNDLEAKRLAKQNRLPTYINLGKLP